MSLLANLDRVVSRRQELESLLSTHPDPGGDDYLKLTREFSEIGPIVEEIEKFKGYQSEMEDLEAMMADPDSDKEMRQMAESEFHDLKKAMPDHERNIQILLLPKDETDARNAILEVRAGTGGDEAGLFAGELLRMYQRYSVSQGWKFEITEESETGVGGIKDASAVITGTNVFSKLKFESGVHRVQRVPVTESGGRVHTSAATVAVLPEAEAIDVVIRQEDLRIDTMRASGAGGQHVNTTDSAVRITHIPTGVVATSSEKSQHVNRDKAMKLLATRLYDIQRQKIDSERSADRKSQVGSGDRSERIRTYNFPQGRMTDHRINLTLYKLDRIMTGEALDEVLDALISEDQAAKLAEING
ncbi:MAG: peptide chain release factor 1 [Alphaproteobacteria bacterium]